MLSRIDEVDEALAAFQKSLELQPDSPEALYKLGVIYDCKKEPLLAQAMYRKARELREDWRSLNVRCV